MLIKQVSTKSLNQINFNNHRIINTINPHSYCVALKDVDFRNALKNSDILLPDGIGIVWAEKVFKWTIVLKKLLVTIYFLFLMNKLNNENGSVFF